MTYRPRTGATVSADPLDDPPALRCQTRTLTFAGRLPVESLTRPEMVWRASVCSQTPEARHAASARRESVSDMRTLD
jgi:hypothetical protein